MAAGLSVRLACLSSFFSSSFFFRSAAFASTRPGSSKNGERTPSCSSTR